MKQNEGKRVMSSGIRVQLREVEADEREILEFPPATAAITAKIAASHRMTAALVRFGSALAEEIRRENPRLVAVEITGVRFITRYARRVVRCKRCGQELRGDVCPGCGRIEDGDLRC